MQVSGTSLLTLIITAILLGIACIAMPTNQVHRNDHPPVASTIKWPSTESQNPFKLQDPLITYSSNSDSISTVNHSHKSQAYENVDSQTTSIPSIPSESVVVSSEPSTTLAAKSESALPLKSSAVTSQPSLPSKSAVITSEPTLPSKSSADYLHKRRDSRSPSPKKRHPESAVKWHKIRHLWLDSD